MFKFGEMLRRALLITGASFLMALAVNATRPTPVLWIAQADYEIFEDCDETTESAEPIEIAEIMKHVDWYMVVDSRDPEPYEEWHLEGSYSLPYDPLFSVDEETINALRSEAGDRSVVVVGEGEIAKLLADDLLSQGLSWVQFINPEEDWRILKASDAD